MTSSFSKNSVENINPNDDKINNEINNSSIKDKTNYNNAIPKKDDFFDEIMKELEANKISNKEKEINANIELLNNNENININELGINDFKISDNNNNSKKTDDSQFIRMQKLKEGLQVQPHFDFGIPLNENASLSIIQKYKDKKEINENFQKALSKINILKWLKVYTILMNKEIQNVNLALNQIRKLYSFDFSKTSILCEVKNLYIIDCYQLLDVIDANFSTKKIILTKNVKKNSKDKGKIKIFYEYFVNIGDLILFKKPKLKPNIIYGEEYVELDIKDIQKIVPYNDNH
jgi:hypothetical protein